MLYWEHDNKTYIYVHTFSNTDIIKLPSEHAVHLDEEKTGLQSKRKDNTFIWFSLFHWRQIGIYTIK